MVERGLLHRMHRGVHAFGALSPAPESRWAAALLAAGKGAALSRTGAAAFYGQLVVREVIEVTAPTQRRGDARLKVHTAKTFEVVPKKGLLVTTPVQTLLDLAAANWPIDRMTHEMAASGIVSLDALRTFARNRRGEPGARALAKALDLPHTRSEWERRFLRWVTRLDQRDRRPHRRLPLARPQPRHRARYRADARQRLEETRRRRARHVAADEGQGGVARRRGNLGPAGARTPAAP